ncbi:hypothetical protein TNCV_1349941 [Trichonephila clavipes]|nr:hypothetical protein TNCV_1349941 [Trichonephila clavipes]
MEIHWKDDSIILIQSNGFSATAGIEYFRFSNSVLHTSPLATATGPRNFKAHYLPVPLGRHPASFDHVSEFDRGRIVDYRDCGLSFKAIGQHVGRNQATVMRICQGDARLPLSARVTIGLTKTHDMAARVMTDPPPCLAVGRRTQRSYANAGVLQTCTLPVARKKSA